MYFSVESHVNDKSPVSTQFHVTSKLAAPQTQRLFVVCASTKNRHCSRAVALWERRV